MNLCKEIWIISLSETMNKLTNHVAGNKIVRWGWSVSLRTILAVISIYIILCTHLVSNPNIKSSVNCYPSKLAFIIVPANYTKMNASFEK